MTPKSRVLTRSMHTRRTRAQIDAPAFGHDERRRRRSCRPSTRRQREPSHHRRTRRRDRTRPLRRRLHCPRQEAARARPEDPPPPCEVTRYRSLAEFWSLSEHVTGINATTLIQASRAELADSALHAPQAGFGDTDFYPDPYDKAAVLACRIAWNHPLPDGSKRAHGRASFCSSTFSFPHVSSLESESSHVRVIRGSVRFEHSVLQVACSSGRVRSASLGVCVCVLAGRCPLLRLLFRCLVCWPGVGVVVRRAGTTVPLRSCWSRSFRARSLPRRLGQLGRGRWGAPSCRS